MLIRRLCFACLIYEEQLSLTGSGANILPCILECLWCSVGPCDRHVSQSASYYLSFFCHVSGLQTCIVVIAVLCMYV